MTYVLVLLNIENSYQMKYINHIVKGKKLQYNVIFRPEPEGGFTALVPSLPGCLSYGKNLTEAKKMVIDAIEGYIESLNKHHEDIPSDEKNFVSLVSIPKYQKV